MHDSVMPDSSLLLCQIPDSNFHVMPDSVMPLSVIPLSTFLLWLIPLWQIPLCSFLILKIIPDSVMPHYVMPKSVMTGSWGPMSCLSPWIDLVRGLFLRPWFKVECPLRINNHFFPLEFRYSGRQLICFWRGRWQTSAAQWKTRKSISPVGVPLV